MAATVHDFKNVVYTFKSVAIPFEPLRHEAGTHFKQNRDSLQESLNCRGWEASPRLSLGSTYATAGTIICDF